ncbi:hypothetical protein EYF80_000501 [Liparis tanakae]|uniref:Uncharacterized protein n=1 Tax=Liparis tanakae TaxID=230148 RepID=A0A4Z2JHC9_9TELE|nr:hypothetical protein EYF80_000501 [Liparis tanakae]
MVSTSRRAASPCVPLAPPEKKVAFSSHTPYRAANTALVSITSGREREKQGKALSSPVRSSQSSVSTTPPPGNGQVLTVSGDRPAERQRRDERGPVDTRLWSLLHTSSILSWDSTRGALMLLSSSPFIPAPPFSQELSFSSSAPLSMFPLSNRLSHQFIDLSTAVPGAPAGPRATHTAPLRDEEEREQVGEVEKTAKDSIKELKRGSFFCLLLIWSKAQDWFGKMADDSVAVRSSSLSNGLEKII